MTDEAASKGFGATIAYLMYPSLQTGATSVPPCSDSPLEMDDAALEKALLLAVSHGDVESDAFASANGADHKKVVGLIKSLESSELVASTAKDHSALKLSPEAEAYLTAGSPEAQAFAAVPSGAGIPLADFKKLDKTISDIGFKQAMQQKWLAMEKGETPMVVRKADSVEDIAKGFLAAINAGDVASVPPKELDALVKKRKLVKQETWKTFTISKGASFALERKKAASDLTKEMLQDGSWRDAEFKSYNLVPGAGAPPNGGCVHPLLKVRQQFREIFLQMGFAEMPTNNFVESGFWNFDTLIQPQMHPARDAHDTFFMKTPGEFLFTFLYAIRLTSRVLCSQPPRTELRRITLNGSGPCTRRAAAGPSVTSTAGSDPRRIRTSSARTPPRCRRDACTSSRRTASGPPSFSASTGCSATKPWTVRTSPSFTRWRVSSATWV